MALIGVDVVYQCFMLTSRLILIIGVLILIGCKQEISISTEYISDGFDYPVGKKPNAKGYTDKQLFGKNYHLGSDWNGNGGGNTDLKDPVFSISNGYVKSAKNLKGGWGNVIRIIHELPSGKQVESLYAHCDKILVKPNTFVKKVKS